MNERFFSPPLSFNVSSFSILAITATKSFDCTFLSPPPLLPQQRGPAFTTQARDIYFGARRREGEGMALLHPLSSLSVPLNCENSGGRWHQAKDGGKSRTAAIPGTLCTYCTYREMTKKGNNASTSPQHLVFLREGRSKFLNLKFQAL